MGSGVQEDKLILLHDRGTWRWVMNCWAYNFLQHTGKETPVAAVPFRSAAAMFAAAMIIWIRVNTVQPIRST